ncbi:hypothetical protein [Subtercola endophyticus]|uniref:hypothetical protein n=1 Tax=Subtercola endophyticus TaxID=2895559 RepID=UPI001E377ADF|nr:hypothetical protein [Subtercola endophyticus]UFS58927.1 hypothetical protein LQ955_18350 [Subtercola endophyticus]
MTDTMVTAEHVKLAEREAAEAEALVASLEQAVINGDESVTPEQLQSSESLSRFASLRASATRLRAERDRIAAEVAARRDLRVEIESASTATATELTRLLKAVEDAVQTFVDRTEGHDERVREWGQRLRALGVPEMGRPSAAHEGLGLSAVGDILAGNTRVQQINGPHILNLIFRHFEASGGRLVPADPQRREAAFALLASLGAKEE